MSEEIDEDDFNSLASEFLTENHRKGIIIKKSDNRTPRQLCTGIECCIPIARVVCADYQILNIKIAITLES